MPLRQFMSITTYLKGGRVIDPVNNTDEIKDLYFRNGKITMPPQDDSETKIKEINVEGKIVFPGLVDLRNHLKNISGGQAENIKTGTKAAAAGGYTTILLMPDTDPRADNTGTIQYIQDRILKHASIKVLLCGCLTKEAKGESLAPLGSLKENGVVAISDCPRTTQNNQIFSKGVEYASMFNLPVIDLPRDLSLSDNGSAHDGPLALKLGLGGYPRIAEELFVQRAISVSKTVDTKIHLSSISTFGSVEMIKEAKKQNIKISADVTAHHLTLNETSINDYNPNFKTSPPIREEIDRIALIKGLNDGTIDCVCSAHQPFQEHEKNVEYDLAPSGVTGFETALSVCYNTLIEENSFSWIKLISLMSSNPPVILGEKSDQLTDGNYANITIFDPKLKWNYSEKNRETEASNSPFADKNFTGKITKTFYRGEEVYSF
jgi:dihydroorotase